MPIEHSFDRPDDNPVLSFIEVDDDFICVIQYPDGNVDNFPLGSNYDTAIEQYLAMVESYRHSIQ